MAPKLPWKAWHEVLMQRGKRPIYEKADEFFALTFPTYNLRRLVRDVVRNYLSPQVRRTIDEF